MENLFNWFDWFYKNMNQIFGIPITPLLKYWRERREQQLQYIRHLADRHFEWSGRMQMLLMSALEVLEMIENEIKKHD